MKNFALCLMALAATLLFATDADAQLFGRRNQSTTVVNGGNVTQINQTRGLFGRVQNTNVTQVDRFGNVSETSIRNRGLLGNRQQINSTFIGNSRNRARVRNFNGVNVNVNVNGSRLNSFGSVRVNAFGTRVFVDRFGNAFEVDVLGNSRFVGNRFNRGFSGSAFTTFSTFGLRNSFRGFAAFGLGCH